MTQKRSPWNIAGKAPQTQYEWHVLRVYRDPDFISDVAHLERDSKDPFLMGFTKVEYGDKVPDDGQPTITKRKLQEKYQIGYDDLLQFVMGFYKLLGPARSDLPYELEYDFDGNATLKFKLNISKEDFDHAWQLVHGLSRAQYGKAAERFKPYDELELIYSIFKLRQMERPPTFTQIFNQYQNGELEGYVGEHERFLTADDLQRYYNRRRPAAPPGAIL